MRVVMERDYDAVSRRAADVVEELVRSKPRAVLGLATGSTPLGLYGELIRRHRQEGLDFSRVTTFNLDEYLGLEPTHGQSYHHFMHENLLDHINVPPGNVHIPSGTASDVRGWCDAYEKRVRDCGGIDLQVLGIGSDGHIAFNEPGSSLGSRTRVVALAAETIRDNARFFAEGEEVPRLAVTMGVGTILEAARCLLIASGKGKAEILAQAIEGPVTSQVTASGLQLHPRVVVMCDLEAASCLKRRDYYDHVERASAEYAWLD